MSAAFGFSAFLVTSSAPVSGEPVDFTNVTTCTDLGSAVTNSGGFVSGPPVTFSMAGTFQILASFAGDPTAGLAASSATEDSTATLTVLPAPVATPLPAALPLFAAGLGGFGFLGWRRKRKARAAVA
jgi:hypothetical protein